MMAGICSGTDQLGWEDSARRLLGVMMTGLRAAPRAPTPSLLPRSPA
jgi:hypothetical protein